MSELLKKYIPKIARRVKIPYSIWLSILSKKNTFYSISEERRFEHDEYSYDSQYENEMDFRSGEGLTILIEKYNLPKNKPLLEIGCGTGVLSAGLVKSNFFSKYLITDPSSAFLDISKTKLTKAGLDLKNTDFGILNADDMIALPKKMFSAIAIRATLHHILHYEAFIKYSAKALAKNGILVFQEPCREGYILMGALTQFLPLVLETKKIKLTEKQKDSIQIFIDTMKFYSRTDINKSLAEDKHLFKVDEIMNIGKKFNLKTDFYPNMNFEDFFSGKVEIEQNKFTTFYINYLKYCMSFDDELIENIKNHFIQYSGFIEEISGNNNCPYLDGVFVCQKV